MCVKEHKEDMEVGRARVCVCVCVCVYVRVCARETKRACTRVYACSVCKCGCAFKRSWGMLVSTVSTNRQRVASDRV